MSSRPGQRSLGIINVSLTIIIMASLVIIVIETSRRAYRVLAKNQYTVHGRTVASSRGEFIPPDFGQA
jgi:predicted DCC family thiol-disulfide oxidoreductase YuxK